jgi:hypothetical protein
MEGSLSVLVVSERILSALMVVLRDTGGIEGKGPSGGDFSVEV